MLNLQRFFLVACIFFSSTHFIVCDEASSNAIEPKNVALVLPDLKTATVNEIKLALAASIQRLSLSFKKTGNLFKTNPAMQETLNSLSQDTLAVFKFYLMGSPLDLFDNQLDLTKAQAFKTERELILELNEETQKIYADASKLKIQLFKAIIVESKSAQESCSLFYRYQQEVLALCRNNVETIPLAKIYLILTELVLGGMEQAVSVASFCTPQMFAASLPTRKHFFAWIKLGAKLFHKHTPFPIFDLELVKTKMEDNAALIKKINAVIIELIESSKK